MSENSTTAPAAAPPREDKWHVFRWLRRLYDWTLSWGNSRWGLSALGILAFTESVIFPIPTDSLLMALCLGHPKKSFRFATVATVFSVLGAIAGYALGFWLWQTLASFFFEYMPGFTPDTFQYIQAKYQENAFLTIFAAAFTPIPFKVFTIASGVFAVGLPTLLAASLLGRGLRFFAVAAMLRWAGEPARKFIDQNFNLLTVIFFVLLALGFWVIQRLL